MLIGTTTDKITDAAGNPIDGETKKETDYLLISYPALICIGAFIFIFIAVYTYKKCEEAKKIKTKIIFK